MSIFPSWRGLAQLFRTSHTSERDDEVAVYAGTGAASSTLPSGEELASDQVAVRYQSDAVSAADVVRVSVDGKNFTDAMGATTSRYGLSWLAGGRGKPGLNADIQNAAEATRMVTDPDFEVLGTNATSDDVTFYAEGGITMETDGADDDQVILLPHLDANQSAWSQITWGTDKEVIWECSITTGPSIVDAIIWAGLKLTNVDVTATDADQVMFRYEEGVQSGVWEAINSIGGVDVETDSGVTVALGTKYDLKIVIDSSRIAKLYIDEVLVGTSAALTDTTDLIPYVGVMCQVGGASGAKSILVHSQKISRAIG